MVRNQRNVNVKPNQHARYDHTNVRPHTPQDPTQTRWALMQFLLMLVSVGRTALDVRVTRIDEMRSERRSLGVKHSRKGVRHPQAVSRLSWKLRRPKCAGYLRS
jgi:hypothetical protein